VGGSANPGQNPCRAEGVTAGKAATDRESMGTEESKYRTIEGIFTIYQTI